MRARKLGYYARSLAALDAAAVSRAQLARVVARGRGTVELRAGAVFRLGSRLDLLVLNEVVLDDVYGLGTLSSPSLIVDVGAGLGDFAVTASRRFPRCRVLAFEPDHGRYELLSANAAANRARLELHRLAVGARTLDGYIGEATVDLLKVDCEGAELEVLETGADVLRIALEYHNFGRRRRDLAAAGLLTERGFEVRLEPDPYDPEIGYLLAAR